MKTPTAKLYQLIASEIARLHYCEATQTNQPHHADNAANARERLRILEEELPSGSGIDCGTKIDLDASTDKKIVLTLSYHHMDDEGMYDGWTDHKIVLTPAFNGYAITVTGKDRNGIKEYLADTYMHVLHADYSWRGMDLRRAE